MIKHNIKKATFCLLMSIITMGFTAACSNSSNISNVGAGERRQELEGTITFVSNRTDKINELKELISDFEEIHPKVKINLEIIGDAENILQRKLAIGELADVTLVPSNVMVSEYNKYFLPIDELGFDEDTIYNYYSGIGSDSKLYTLTTSLKWLGIVYNKVIFEKAGIDEVPRTIPEFMNACKKIKDIDVTPMALNYTEPWAVGIWSDEIPYLYDDDIEYDVMLKSQDIMGDESGLYKSLEFIRGILDNGYFEDDLLNYSWEQCKNDFISGKIAMITFTSNLRYQFEDMGMSRDNIGMFPIPETEVVSITGEYKYAVSRNTQYPEVSKEFLKYLFEMDRYANTVNIVPTLKSSKENIRIINELEVFDIRIQMHENVMKDQNEDAIKLHDNFYNLKKSLGINSEFVQQYLMSSDRDTLRKSINEMWKGFQE